MHYTKIISKEYFTAGRPLTIVLPVAEESTTNEKVAYLVKQLHTLSRWPILVHNLGYEMEKKYVHRNYSGRELYDIAIRNLCCWGII
jgi:carbonic anhydrase